MNGEARGNGDKRGGQVGFSPFLWHVVIAALLVTLITSGCSSGNSSGGSPGAKPGAPMGPFAPAKPAAAEPSALSPLARAPKAVRDAFNNDYRDGANVTKMRHMLMPDGLVHYTITSTDSSGKEHVDEYRADGVKVNAAK
jgi:hypothetical protein